MRRLMFLLIAVSFLGPLVGCNTCGSGCGLTSNCGTSGCSTGRCGAGDRSHSHGICDCEHDDYCSSRTPWVRHGYTGIATPASAPITEVIPAAPTKLPNGKMKL